MVWSSINLLRSSVGLTAIMGLLTILHPFAIVVLVATVLPSVLMQGYFARKRFDFDTQWVRNDRMLDYLVRLLTSRDSAKEVRIFTLTDTFASRYWKFRETQLAAYLKMLIDIFKVRSGLDVITLAGVASIWAYAVHQAVLGRITIGDLTLVFNAAQQGRGLLTSLVGSGGQVYENALFATRFFDLLDLDPQSMEAALAPRRPNPAPLPAPIRQGVESARRSNSAATMPLSPREASTPPCSKPRRRVTADAVDVPCLDMRRCVMMSGAPITSPP